jgi:transcription antitermination factor NusA-like protein
MDIPVGQPDLIINSPYPTGGESADIIMYGSSPAGDVSNIILDARVMNVGGQNDLTLGTTTSTLKFFTTVPGVTKQTVVGSRGANAALTSLLTALANYGLITNNSTP